MKQISVKQTGGMLAVASATGIALSLLWGQVPSAQGISPTKGKGVAAKTLVSFELAPQIPELQGRYLRERFITIERGGHTAVHNHKGRAAITYVLQGTASDCRPNGACKDLHEGQAWAEGTVPVWHANRGTKPLTVLVVDISKEP